MTVAPTLYRRLLALGVVSVLLHLLAIDTVARLAHAPVAPEKPSTPLALRLQPALPPPPAPLPAVTASTPQATPLPRPRPRTDVPTPGAHAPQAAALVQAAPTLARPSSAPEANPDDDGDDEQVQTPGRYRVQMPTSATLDYAMTRPDGPPVPVQIGWLTTGNNYTVSVNGVTGPLASAGVVGDTGVRPQAGSMRGADGREVAAAFSADSILIAGRPYKNDIGSQDPASLLMQLTGMGLARPEQMRDTLAIYVATADGPVVMRFRVREEQEELETPLGTFGTRHLVQRVQAGQPRLEVWLAPQRGWLPLQLRMTAADGTVSTQTITRIEQADAPP